MVKNSQNIFLPKSRCPNGTRKNRKTGKCEPTAKIDVSPQLNKKRCENGTRKNSKTGKCEPILKKTTLKSDVSDLLNMSNKSDVLDMSNKSDVSDKSTKTPPLQKVQSTQKTPVKLKKTRKLTVVDEFEKKKRCPQGTRKNRKTGVCEPIKKPKKLIVVDNFTDENIVEPLSLSPIAQKANSVKRCPNGTRKNKKTGVCEPTSRKIVVVKHFDNERFAENNINEILKKPEEQTIPEKEDTHLPEEPTIPEKEDTHLPEEPTISEKEDTHLLKEPNESIAEPTEEKTTEKQEETEEKPIEKQEETPPPVSGIVATLSSLFTPSAKPPPLPSLRPFADEIENQPFKKNTNDYKNFKELFEYKTNETNKNGEADETNEFPFLYPDLNDPNFNLKIAKRKEFNDYRYDGNIYDIKAQSNRLCHADFELSPHQTFVKNFLSLQTPYNSLLLYHGLGTGKTCSAIGISEENRKYMKQIGLSQRIIIIASPNVQDNFRLQLFDESKLILTNGIWNIRACVGNTLINEINPTQLNGMTRERVINSVKSIINTYYVFMGYIEFSNYASKKINAFPAMIINETERQRMRIKNIKRTFNNRLIIVDEVHNIRLVDDNKNKSTAKFLFQIAEYSDNLRLLLLSATPMYNSYKEIIWLINLLNINDKRSQIRIADVFDKKGNFKEIDTTREENRWKEDGKSLLRRKLTGYISYVRSENPYSFPFRIYKLNPIFEKKDENTMNLLKSRTQINGAEIVKPLLHIPIYYTLLGEIQEHAYKLIVDFLKKTNVMGMAQNSDITIEGGRSEKESGGSELSDSLNSSEIQKISPSLIPIVPPMESVTPLNTNTYDATSLNSDKINEDTSQTESTNTEISSVADETNNTSQFPPLPPPPSQTQQPFVKTIKFKEPTIPPSLPFSPPVSLKSEEINNTTPSSFAPNTPPQNEITDAFGYEKLQIPIQSLNIVYPNRILDMAEIETKDQLSLIVGKKGLEETMDFVDNSNTKQPEKFNYNYKSGILAKYGRIFHKDNIHKYSAKISNICDTIRKTRTGIIMIYSQYIDGGIVPISLALEEMGFSRFGTASYTKSLFKTPPTEPVDANTMKTRRELAVNDPTATFHPAKYTIISGDIVFSPNNGDDIKYLTSPENKHGEKVKVVIISKAGAEGLDFKNIRQIHIMESWYNMNRTEQIIGRGVRNLSHCGLPFEERNVEIFLYSSVMPSYPEEECADTYVYRMAESKSIQIGRITRLLKETSVDCMLNIEQTNFSAAKLNALVQNQHIKIRISSEGGKEIDHIIGDRPYTDMCDYMENCEYSCYPNTAPSAIDFNDPEFKPDKSTYGMEYVRGNNGRIAQRIRELFKEQPFYSRKNLIQSLNAQKAYPIEQIYSTLTDLVSNKNEYIVDKYDRLGNLVNKGDIYAFQPIEITDDTIPIFERDAPIEYKRQYLSLPVPAEFKETDGVGKDKNTTIDDEKRVAADLGDNHHPPNQNFPNKNPKIANIIKEIETNYEILNTLRVDDFKHISQKKKTFFMNVRIIKEHLSSVFHIPANTIDKYSVFKMLDSLNLKEKIMVLDEMTTDNSFLSTNPAINGYIYDYFETKKLKLDAVILADDKMNPVIYQRISSSNPAVIGWKQQYNTSPFNAEIRRFIVDGNTINDLFGYVEKGVFKIRERNNKENRGFNIAQAGKQRSLEILNRVVDIFNQSQRRQIREYTKENTDDIYQLEICAIIEMAIRFLKEKQASATQPDNLVVFLTEEEYAIVKKYIA
jgi:hypothetical protein